MKINWFTVIAQAINFVVLVWLLKRFLYKPILKAIDEREKKIASQLKEAEDKKSVAEKEQDDFRKKNEDFDRLKKGLMDKAVADSNAERDKLTEGVKKDAVILRAGLEKSIQDQQESQNDEIAQKTAQAVFSITRKALTEIASASLEEQTVNTFIRRLDAAKDEEKKQFTDAFRSNANTILIRSAFDLPPKQQEDLSNAVDKVLGDKSRLQFATTPELISGIELTTNGYKLAWSFSEYLHSLEQSIPAKPKETTEKVQAKREPVTEKIQHASN
jgi:F-type H+-transporting ATPase subunit b